MTKRRKRKSTLKYRQRKLETYTFTRQLYDFLREHPDSISFKKLRKICGYYDAEHEEIVIDPRRDIVATLIHEAAHHIHTNWCETKILQKEHQVMSCLSPTQCTNIIIALGMSLK
jgi:hypothetical protein